MRWYCARLDTSVRPSCGSLDAIHLATALSIGNDLGAMYCYDARLAAAATAAGLRVLAPA